MEVDLTGMFLIFLLGILLGFLFFVIYTDTWISLNNSTAKEICKNLTGHDVNFKVKAEWGKLVCEEPSYDDTQNIIVRKGGKT